MSECSFGVCAFGRQCVEGDGPLPAPLLIIGEAPGANELRYGRPFVGRSGEELAQYLDAHHLRRIDIRVTNTCGCVDMTREDKRPLPAELEACQPRLMEEIALCDPRVILLMGNTAIQTFFPGERVGQIYNTMRQVNTYTIIPTYHPAAALRGAQVRPVISQAIALAKQLIEE